MLKRLRKLTSLKGASISAKKGSGDILLGPVIWDGLRLARAINYFAVFRVGEVDLVDTLSHSPETMRTSGSLTALSRHHHVLGTLLPCQGTHHMKKN